MEKEARTTKVFNEIVSFIKNDLGCKILSKEWESATFTNSVEDSRKYGNEGSITKITICNQPCIVYEFNNLSKTIYMAEHPDEDFYLGEDFRGYTIIGSSVLLRKIVEESLL